MAGSNGALRPFPSLDGTGPDALDAAAQALRQAGGVLDLHAFSAQFLAALVQAAPRGRLDAPALAGPLAAPELLAHPRITALAERTLGAGFNMGRLRLGALSSADLAQLGPGCALYGEPRFDRQVPAVGLALLVPLSAVSLRVWPGSQRDAGEAAAALALEPGAAFVFDARLRVLLADPGPLPALLAVYYRHWFREPRAADGTPAVAISRAAYHGLPEAQRSLFSWRFDRYASRRPRLALHRALSHLPGPLMDLVSKVIKRG
jgi:hypothetical protein